jgi:hypothetical protein
MTTTIVAQPANVTRQHVGIALRQLRIAYARDRRRLNAVNRAALNLEATIWQWNGSDLRIESATQTGSITYQVSGHACTCPAAQHGKPCWHQAAHEILLDAQAIAEQPTPVRMSDVQYARVLDAADDLFN